MKVQTVLNILAYGGGAVAWFWLAARAMGEHDRFRKMGWSEWGAFWWVGAWVFGLAALVPGLIIGFAEWVTWPFAHAKYPVTAEMLVTAVTPVMWWYGGVAILAITGAIVFALWRMFVAALRHIAREIAAGTAEGRARERDAKPGLSA
jgi:hypothetical protein